jgi:hypothetical protein
MRVIAQKSFQIFFKTINVGTQRGYPIGIEGFLDEGLFLAAHVGQREPDTVIFHYV